MDETPVWATVLTALVALYAAAVSTIELALRLRSDRPRLQVRMEIGFRFDYGKAGPPSMFVHAANPGTRPVTLAAQAMVRLPNGHRLLFPETNVLAALPYEIKPSASFTSWIDMSQLVSSLAGQGYTERCKVRGLYRDQVDRTFKSKPMTINVKDWLQSA